MPSLPQSSTRSPKAFLLSEIVQRELSGVAEDQVQIFLCEISAHICPWDQVVYINGC